MEMLDPRRREILGGRERLDGEMEWRRRKEKRECKRREMGERERWETYMRERPNGGEGDRK